MLFLNAEGVTQISELRSDFNPPLKIPISYSGSFGELRRTHFHSGVDMRTNGRCGYRVYASEDGFVARIVVSPTGYGRAVYIQHPNGLMTVYAHLRNFAPIIESYVRKEQYKKESWALDVGLPEGKIPVKKGMIIGNSGNSGSSGGPHLHYEIRDAVTQDPINPFFYFKPKDNIRPKIQFLYVYNVDRGKDIFSCPVRRFKVDYVNKKFVIRNNTVIKSSGNLGFGVKVKDFINGSWNSCGVYSVKLFVNDELRYSYEADRFSFSNTSCVNVVKDYKIDVEKNQKIYKAWIPGSSCFECVKCCKDNGFVGVEKDSVYDVRFEIRDLVGNKSLLKFKVKGNGQKVKVKKDETGRYRAGNSYHIDLGDLRVIMPKKSLFDDVCFLSSIDTIRDKGYLNDLVYNMGGDHVPLRSKVSLFVRLSKDVVSKAYFVNGINGCKLEAVRSSVEKDGLRCRVKNLGRFSVCLDTVSPKIIPLGKYRMRSFGNKSRMLFKIEEKESGLRKYEGRLDGVWMLTSYNAKSRLVECFFDELRIKTGSRHDFVLTVSDRCGNISSYKTVVYF